MIDLGTVSAGIGETTYYSSEVDDLRNFVASKGWSLNKYKSISAHLQSQIVNNDRLRDYQITKEDSE